MEEKKGAGRKPAPKKDKQLYYSSISNYCLGLFIIAITIVMVAYARGKDNAVFFGIGMMSGTALLQMKVNNIFIQDEEDDENERED